MLDLSGQSLSALLRDAAEALTDNGPLYDRLTDMVTRLEQPRELRVVLEPTSGPDSIFVECENAGGKWVSPDSRLLNQGPNGRYHVLIFNQIPE
jgi:hypothetical protein